MRTPAVKHGFKFILGSQGFSNAITGLVFAANIEWQRYINFLLRTPQVGLDLRME